MHRPARSLLPLVVLFCSLAGGGCSSVTATPWTLHADEVYTTRGATPLTADVYEPAAGGSERPAVVVIHGGGWARGEPAQMERIAERLADAGFVVANVRYRLAPEATWPAQAEDVGDAVRWLRSNAGRFGVDPQRIGAWGYSAGAHLAALLGYMDDVPGDDPALAAQSARVQAVVGGGTPSDLTRWPDSPLVNDFLGAPIDAARPAWEAASPVFHVSTGDAPTYLYHGRHDAIVAFEQAEILRDALVRADVPVTLSPRNFGHIWVFLFARGEDRAGTAFLRRTLGP